MAKQCLVTGGSGFIGSHLVEALLANGWLVRVIDTGFAHTSNLENVIEQIELVEGDFGDRYVARSALDGVDTLLHYASSTTPSTAYGRSAFDVTTNLVGTLQLLEEAVACGVKRLIFPSSGGTVYGAAKEVPIQETSTLMPISSHGIVKLAIENYIQLFGRECDLQFTILRYANPFGPRQRPGTGQGVIATFAEKILTRQSILVWGDGSVVRDYIFIDDLVQATLASLDSKEAVNQVINIGSGIGVSIRELVDQIEHITGISAEVDFRPAREFDVPISILDIHKAQLLLGWAPAISLQQGLQKTIAWLNGTRS